MMRRLVVCDPAICTGCRLCEFACSLEKTGAFDLEASRIRAASPTPTSAISIACQLCEAAPCVAACPRSALSVRPEGRYHRAGEGALHQLRLVHRGVRLRGHRPGAAHQVSGDLRSVQGAAGAQMRGELPQEALALSSSAAVAGRSRKRAAEQLLRDSKERE